MGRKSLAVFIVWRELTRKECPWLERNYRPGEVLYHFEGHTYGCVSSSGLALTEVAGENPFVEIPKSAVLKLW